MLEQINTMVEAQCNDKSLEFECHIRGHVDDYYISDEMKLKQILINILGNAVKFTEAPGRVTFLVEEEKRDSKYSYVRFVIKDTGIGMDPEYIPKIFDPFSQEVEGTSNKYGSTGLGLAITKRIVDMMKGTIEVESAKNMGSIFTLVIPLGISEKTGTDGVEVTRQLRQKLHDDSTTVILTTYNWDEIMDEALKAGVDAFFAKPLFAKSMRAEIKEIMLEKRKRYRDGSKMGISLSSGSDLIFCISSYPFISGIS